jgi:integrase
MSKSTEPKPRRKPTKPEKPFEGFPMFAHSGSGQWAKKIRGRLEYFGSWRLDPEGTSALARFSHEWSFLKDGRTPPPIDIGNGCTIKALVNDFLHSKDEKLRAGELSPRTFRDYYKSCERLIEHFGRPRLVTDLRPDDFRSYRAVLAKRLRVVSLRNEINRVCSVFNHAHDNNLVEKPVSYGTAFDRPSAKALRKNRNEAGAKLFERDEILRVLGYPPWAPAADIQLSAMILLGVNCGFGNSDVANLPRSALDLNGGWVVFPRVKTEIPRRIPLWQETIAAISSALAVRPAPADSTHRDRVFLTRLGKPWVRVQPKVRKQEADASSETGPEVAVPIDAISGQFGKLLGQLDINGRRGLGFYTLRHNFETYAGECKDQVAVDAIMGHVDSSMAATYRHRISDDRLRAVVETVRAWLFTCPPATVGAKGRQAP